MLAMKSGAIRYPAPIIPAEVAMVNQNAEVRQKALAVL
jgi:hypothetical protein